jgi:acyl carrier protein
MGLRATMFHEIRAVAEEQEKQLPPLTDELSLQEAGFDSLCFAILFARLEDITGGDPLAMSTDFPRTIGDLVALYDQAIA